MNKRDLHQYWASFRRVSHWVFLALFLVSTTVAILALRNNNQTMARLRNDVYQADQQNGNVQAALKNLQKYVYGHMNTDLASGPNAVYPPIQLKYTYQRLQTAQEQQASTVNSALYTDAEYYCQQQNPVAFSGRTRVPCIEAYVEQHGAAAQPPIPTALYEFDFISPSWSPDLAGWSLLLSAFSLALFMICFALNKIVRKAKR